MRLTRALSTLGLAAALLLGSSSMVMALDYVVRSGDSLSRIAARHGTTVARIRALNNLSGNLIHPGQTLRLPDPAGSSSTPTNYTVRGGDSLSGIADRFGTTVSAIKSLNGLVTNTIVVGQVLRIPGSAPSTSTTTTTTTTTTTPSSTGNFRYTVRVGDSLTRIANRYNTTASAIRSLNGLSGNLILIGQVLTIPGSGAANSFAAGSSNSGTHWAVRRVPRMNATAQEVEIMARIIKGECPPTTPFEGKVAVGAVIMNRVRSSRFPNSIRRVAHQRLQFSSYNSNVRNRLYWGTVPNWAYTAARNALDGNDPTGGATHYFNPYLVAPSWKNNLQFVRRIENTGSSTLRRLTGHDFYRPRGLATGIVRVLAGTTN